MFPLKMNTDIAPAPFAPSNHPRFTFIDLFAGIGGFRLAMQNLGGRCVFSSEWDTDAQKTYQANFGDTPHGDITLKATKDLIPPSFDILCAGFPCQAFSVAGYRKGFDDERGTLFFDIADILSTRRPKAFLLENVKNLQTHDQGRTFRIITSTLRDLGYSIRHKVLNSMLYANVPQNRERILIVGFDPRQVPSHTAFAFPEPTPLTRTIHSCLEPHVTDERFYYRGDKPMCQKLRREMTDSDTVYQWRRQYVRRNQSNVCPTLTANMGTGGHNVPLILTPEGIRKLTPRECLNFQGYPPEYAFPPIALSKQYKQAGNSVTVPLIQAVAQRMVSLL